MPRATRPCAEVDAGRPHRRHDWWIPDGQAIAEEEVFVCPGLMDLGVVPTAGVPCEEERFHGPHGTGSWCPGVPPVTLLAAAERVGIPFPPNGAGWVIPPDPDAAQRLGEAAIRGAPVVLPDPPELLDLRYAPLAEDVRLLVGYVEDVHSADDQAVCAVARRVARYLPAPKLHPPDPELGVVVSFRFPVEWFDSVKAWDGTRTPDEILAGFEARPAQPSPLDVLQTYARAAVAAMPASGYQPTDEQVEAFMARCDMDRDRAVEVLRAAAEVLPLEAEER